jgi:K+-sensing histidine kinase KdpD
MKNKKNPTTNELIFHERISITVLVMSVMAIFILLVGFLVPFFQRRNLSTSAYSSLDKAVVKCVNATYGYGSNENLLVEYNSTVFVLIKDNDGVQCFPEDMSKEKQQNHISQMEEQVASQDSRKNSLTDGIYTSLMDSSYIERNLDIEKDTEILSKPIDVPDEAIVYAGIDRKQELESSISFSWILGTVLIIGFLCLVPVVYIISGRVMKPTKDTMKHEKEFVANASHELKTPLAIITADAEILREKNSENNQYVSNIISQCQNMNETILDMIDLSKLEAAQRALADVDYSQVLLNLCLSFDALAFEREIDYSYDIDPNIVLHNADKKNLVRLSNLLIDNAMKYTEDPKFIRVSLKMEKRGPVLKVYNSGCQIFDEDREKVFERFYQGKSGADNERKGSGLGLAIVKQICETYHYHISIDSHYHKDMKFTIVFR